MGAEPIPSPTAEQVDALHHQFREELRRIFEQSTPATAPLACDFSLLTRVGVARRGADKMRHPGYAEKRLYFDGEDDLGEEEVERVREQRRLEEFHVLPARL